MAKTLSNLRDHVRVYLDEVSTADWTDAQINRELNYAYMEVYTAVIETYEDYYRTKATADLTANTQEYQLPDDFFKMRRLEVTYTSGESANKAIRTDFEQNKFQLSSSTQGSTSRPLYDLNGNFLRLLPVPQTDVTAGLYMWYIKQIDELTSDSDEIQIPFPDRYGRLLVIGASAELLRKGQQEESVAAKYDEKFQVGIEKMKQELEDRYADGSRYILDTLQDDLNFENSNSSYIRTL